jgi:GntR family transcriptional repressor for pyruvate dehydrogenase complex
VTASFATLGESTKSSRVVGELERRILTGELSPGERLPTETDLCEMLGVSRSVVRDAIRTLSARGLVSVRQGRGMTVAEPDSNAFGHALVVLLSRSDLTMGDVVDARAALETSLVTLAAERGGAEDWLKLEASLAAFSDAVAHKRWDEARQTHLDFHLGIFRALHLPALEMSLMPMTEIILVSSAPPRQEAQEDWEVETHAPILDGLRAGDPAAAEEAMREHFRVTTTPPHYEQFRSRRFSAVFSEIPWAMP